jgi:O-antigen ligase
MNSILARLEKGYVVLAMLVFSGGPFELILSGGADQETAYKPYDSTLIRLAYLVIYLITFFLLCKQGSRAILQIPKKCLSIWILIGFAALSIIWSASPDVTFEESVTLSGSSLFGLYLASRFSLEEQLRLLAYTLGLAIVMSIAFGVGLPQYAIMGGIHEGAFRGIFIHKNTLGSRLALSAPLFLILGLSSRRYRALCMGFVGVSAALLVPARSTAGAINLLFIICLSQFLKLFKWRYVLIIPILSFLLAVGVVVGTAIVGNFDAILLGLGKDPTLTGRTILWSVVWEKIQQHFWLGYGYEGFWPTQVHPGSYVWRATDWNPTHPHNGFLTIWVDLGLIGVILFATGLVSALRRSFALLRFEPSPIGYWPLVHISLMLFSSLSESTILRTNDLYWILYIAAAHTVAQLVDARNLAPTIAVGQKQTNQIDDFVDWKSKSVNQL